MRPHATLSPRSLLCVYPLALTLMWSCTEANPDFINDPFLEGGGLITAGVMDKEPVGGALVGGEPVGGEPVGGAPVGGEPVGGAPVGGAPVGGEPVGGAPVGGEPVGGEPVGGEPVGGEPVGGAPVGGEPVGGAPVGGEPVGGEPVGGEPVGGEPVGGEPAPVDQDGDGSPVGEDCDDQNPTVAPGLAELCDGLDNDCDAQADEGLTSLCVAELAVAAAEPQHTAFGAVLLSPGDLNNDGYPDVIASAPGALLEDLRDLNANNTSAVYMIDGRTGATIRSLLGRGAYGASLAWGDFNSDGQAELAVGAPQHQAMGRARGSVFLVSATGTQLTSLNNPPNEGSSGLGVALTTLKHPTSTRLAMGEPLYESNNTRVGRLRVRSFNQGWNQPTDHTNFLGNTQLSSLGERVHTIPDLNSDGAEDLITTFVDQSFMNTRRSTWLVNAEGSTSTTSLSPDNASERFGERFVWGDFDSSELGLYAIGDPDGRRGKGRVFWYDPLAGFLSAALDGDALDLEGVGVALASLPSPSSTSSAPQGDLLFVGAERGGVVQVVRFTEDRGVSFEPSISRRDDSFGMSVATSRERAPNGTYRLFIAEPDGDRGRGRVRIFSVR